MGSHRCVRAGSDRSGWRRITVLGVGAGVVCATVTGIGLASGATTSTPSVYSSITPATVLGRSLAADSNTDVAVAGVGSVPSNATSVQLSVTALSGTTTSSMYVYPTGATKPTSANVRWATNQTITIPVTVAVGTAGKIRLTTDGGTVTIKLAVVGYFSPTPATGSAGYAISYGSVAIPSTGVVAASLTVPAGIYDIQATATISLTGGTADEVDCELENTQGVLFDDSQISVDSNIANATLSMSGFDNAPAGTLTMFCYSTNSDASASHLRFNAIQLSSASGSVTTG